MSRSPRWSAPCWRPAPSARSPTRGTPLPQDRRAEHPTRQRLQQHEAGPVHAHDERRLVVWRRRYLDMYNIDPARRPARLQHDRCAQGAWRAAAASRATPERYEAELRAAVGHRTSFTLATELVDGRIIAVVNQPSADGGWVATHEGVTEHRARAEHELELHARLPRHHHRKPCRRRSSSRAGPSSRYVVHQPRRRSLSTESIASRDDGQDRCTMSCRRRASKLIDAEDRKVLNDRRIKVR